MVAIQRASQCLLVLQWTMLAGRMMEKGCDEQIPLQGPAMTLRT